MMFNRINLPNGCYIVKTVTHSVWFNEHEKIHRIDGPAIEAHDGNYFKYWINNFEITEEVNQWRKEMGITNEHFTSEESTLFILYFGDIN